MFLEGLYSASHFQYLVLYLCVIAGWMCSLFFELVRETQQILQHRYLVIFSLNCPLLELLELVICLLSRPQLLRSLFYCQLRLLKRCQPGFVFGKKPGPQLSLLLRLGSV